MGTLLVLCQQGVRHLCRSVGAFHPLARRGAPEDAMTLEMLVGAVGIIVAAITFIGGMLTFTALDKVERRERPA